MCCLILVVYSVSLRQQLQDVGKKLVGAQHYNKEGSTDNRQEIECSMYCFASAILYLSAQTIVSFMSLSERTFGLVLIMLGPDHIMLHLTISPVYTPMWEAIGTYELPTKKAFIFLIYMSILGSCLKLGLREI